MATRVMLLQLLSVLHCLNVVTPIASEPALLEDDECVASDEQCGLHALQRRAHKVMSSSKGRCGPIGAPENEQCRESVSWAAGGGRWDPHAGEWFKDMLDITGMDHQHGSLDDYQRLFFCSPPGGKACGLPPCQCSHPPCDKCFGGGGPAPAPQPAGCGNSSPIDCGPPETALGYKGREWPEMSFAGTGEMHIFAIGDWGGMDGSLNPIENRPPVIAYNRGSQPGPSVFPRTRWNLIHSELLCSYHDFVECFNSRGEPPCPEGCGYVEGVDSQPQVLVANALKARAADKDPQFLLNVGDNFYWGGIEKTCGTPMSEISYTAHHQFDQIFERVYQGTGLDDKPWLSVLGNHDWGGRVFNNGWDQQIAYTWVSKRWILPAPYWSQHVEYPDLDFSIDLYMLDSNFMDATEPSEDPEHNICGEKHNPVDANCTVAGGPASIETCPQYFADLWEEQQAWVVSLMAKSKADWQIVVTHFPCGHEQGFYRRLHQEYGLDLLVTGHRHDQELWLPTMYHKNHMGGLTCIVTGGGGGITSEATPDPENKTNWYGEAQYGFYDLLITKQEIVIHSINYNGTNVMNATVYKS